MTIQSEPDSARPGAGQAVFVSEAPRRVRYVKWLARIGALGAAVYVVITAGSLVGAPWVPHVSLPGVGPLTLEQHPGATADLGPGAQPLATPDLARPATTVVRTSTTIKGAGSSGSGSGSNSGAVTTTTRRRSSSATSTTDPGGQPGADRRSTTTNPSSPTTTDSPGKSGSAPGHSSTTVAHGR